MNEIESTVAESGESESLSVLQDSATPHYDKLQQLLSNEKLPTAAAGRRSAEAGVLLKRCLI